MQTGQSRKLNKPHANTSTQIIGDDVNSDLYI